MPVRCKVCEHQHSNECHYRVTVWGPTGTQKKSCNCKENGDGSGLSSEN